MTIFYTSEGKNKWSSLIRIAHNSLKKRKNVNCVTNNDERGKDQLIMHPKFVALEVSETN
jgi:hypothetical protein